ncbi:hypothetical protein BTZ20_5640 [Rhodococcus sp. MTM3W5.2]|uniref:hypothetical protein n=1 Tax=Rhodococcus sp. MTM3W5.2 TaxID=1805827 RepID=UPI0009791B46|nr:hypothetical protein [Rhodococcus sp. MTM3W5.2]AQA20481.1 hypothetical protein BTZ20_5640 [Rhodococcus sp. MTM3W5.2]
MRLQPRRVDPTVTHNPNCRNPILLLLGSQGYALSCNEARALADQLHDAADQVKQRG